MASLVVSVMSRWASFPLVPARRPRTYGVCSRQWPEEIFPAAPCDDGRFAASRQAATVAKRTLGRNGLCRLLIAPSLVAMTRKSVPSSGPEGIGRPEIAMMGSDVFCCRTSRSVSKPSMPGMKMSRIRRSNASALSRSRPRRPSLAATTLWPAPSRSSRNVIRTALSSSITRIRARAAALSGITSTEG
jgi:hypothetical protein